ncbi:MAG TPA: DedA family protein [Aliidongia sp.]|nr:DedA family protein [Aliidongia sp.]
MEALSGAILDIVRAHAVLAPPIVFALAFGESLAFVSLLLPATVLLVGGGGIVSAAGIGFWSIWSAAAAGAALGDWVSYWLGLHYKEAIGGIWPLSRHPALLSRGQAFFEKWGAAGVFLGRFFGPLRSVMPLVAGICAMPLIPFQIANLTSAVLWATAVLAPGWLAVEWLL